MEKIYYIYLHTSLKTNVVFYVGKGTKAPERGVKQEYHRSKVKRGRTVEWKEIALNENYKIDIVFETSSLSEVDSKETELIKFYGRKDLNLGTLVNLTDGAEAFNSLTGEAAERRNLAVKLGRAKGIETYRKNHVTPITILNIDGTFYKNANSSGEAHEITNTPHTDVCTCLRGLQKSAGKYIFIYTKDYDPTKDYRPIAKNSLLITVHDSNGNFIGEYLGLSKALKSLNIKQGNRSYIMKGLKDKNKQKCILKGYTFTKK